MIITALLILIGLLIVPALRARERDEPVISDGEVKEYFQMFDYMKPYKKDYTINIIK